MSNTYIKNLGTTLKNEQFVSIINPFQINVRFLYPMKTKNRFFDVFRKFGNGTLA